MKRFIVPYGVLVLGLLIGSGTLVARAKEPRLDRADTAVTGTIGSIDMEDIYNASGSPQELEQAARQHEAEGAQRINKIMAVPYLEAAELEEYGTLIGKATMTPEDDKRAGVLKSTSDARENELKTLQTKQDAPLNAEEKTRMAHLIDLKQILQNQVKPGLVADFRSQQEGWVAEYRHRQLIKLRQEVAKVAKEKGISHVFDSGTLIYSVNDLTPIVLQRITKRSGRAGNG